MYKICLFISLFLCAENTIYAQATIAKLKFEQAEESFASNQFAETVYKLDEVEKLLGKTNPKILYLRIMAGYKLLMQDEENKELHTTLKKNTAYYLKNYETVEGIEEKYREVYLVDEDLKQYDPNPDHNKALEYYKTKDYENAQAWFKKAATTGYAKAMVYLGFMYDKGYHFAKDDAKAFEYYLKAAEKGNTSATYNVGIFYMYQRGGQSSHEKGLEYFTRASEKGHGGASNEIGRTYLRSNLFDKAMNNFKKAHAQGNQWGAYNIGWMYYHAKGVTRSFEEARKWFLIQAEKDHLESIIGVADCYRFGLKDNGLAADWYLKGAAKGNYDCLFNLGEIYSEKKDYATALEYYLKAANRNHKGAMAKIGDIYDNGSGEIKKDKKLAKEWYAKYAAAK